MTPDSCMYIYICIYKNDKKNYCHVMHHVSIYHSNSKAHPPFSPLDAKIKNKKLYLNNTDYKRLDISIKSAKKKKQDVSI